MIARHKTRRMMQNLMLKVSQKRNLKKKSSILAYNGKKMMKRWVIVSESRTKRRLTRFKPFNTKTTMS